MIIREEKVLRWDKFGLRLQSNRGPNTMVEVSNGAGRIDLMLL